MATRRKQSVAVFFTALAMVSAAGVTAPSVAGAEPGADPCSGSGVIFCRLLPISPDLEGDIDLTEQSPDTPPVPPVVDAGPPADICARGCA